MFKKIHILSLLMLFVATTVTFGQNADKLEKTTLTDEFGRVGDCDRGARLDAMMIEVQNNPGSKAYVFVYSGTKDVLKYRSEGYVRRWIASLNSYVSLRGYDKSRIIIKNVGFREQSSIVTRIWITPLNGEVPQPTDVVPKPKKPTERAYLADESWFDFQDASFESINNIVENDSYFEAYQNDEEVYLEEEDEEYKKGNNILDSVESKGIELPEYNNTKHLALALWLSAWKNGFMLQLKGYFDETGEYTDENQLFNGMAGFLAPATLWVEIETQWNKLRGNIEYHDVKVRRKRKEKTRKPLIDLLEKFDILPIGWIVSMDTLRSFSASNQEKYGNPYFRAFSYCLSMSTTFVAEHQTPEELDNESVVTVFDEKMLILKQANEYYDKWKQLFPSAGRLAIRPTFKSAKTLPPLQAADLLAGVLKDEYTRQLYKPNESSNDSYLRICQLAERVTGRKVAGQVPFAFIQDASDIQEFVKP